MKCVQRDSLLLVLTFLLLNDARQSLCSYQDEHHRGFGWPNRLRHHHIPERYLAKQQVLSRINLHASLRTATPTPWKAASELRRNPDSVNRKVDEAAHVFRTTTVTHRPLRNKPMPLNGETYHHHPDEDIGQWHHKSAYLPTKSSSFSPVSSKTRHRGAEKASERHEHIKDDDYYYYNEDDSDYAPAGSSDVGFESDEEEYGAGNNTPWGRTTASPERVATKHQSATLIDDYTFDYLDDDPTSSADEKPGSLTEEKWKNYGTAEAVENSRRRHMTEAQIVSAHITRIHLEAMCKHPRPKIIQISDASKRYVPHCTVLHRCGDDTGCCHSDIQTCVAKKTASVDLYFYVIPFGSKDPVVETLSFINHTECHCVDRYRFRMPALTSDNTTESFNTGTVDNKTCHCVRNFSVFEEDVAEDEDSDQTICRCDCLSEEQTCLRLKRGLEGFSVEDRRCISDGRCTAPNCQYGDYNTRLGRCPRSQTKRMIRSHSWRFD